MTKEFEPSYEKILEDIGEINKRYWKLRGFIYEELEVIEKLKQRIERRLGVE